MFPARHRVDAENNREDSHMKATLPPECSKDSRAPVVRPRRREALGLILSLLLPGLLCLDAAAAEPLRWSVTPYLWATETQVDLTADGTPLGGARVTFSDLLDVIDESFQIHVETGRGRFSGFADLTYLTTSDDIGIGSLLIETDSEQWNVDLAVAFWPGGEEKGLSFFGGLRYTSLDDTYEFKLMGTPIGSLRADRDFTDLLLGVRYSYAFSKHWTLASRGDISFGDSEGTFQIETLFRYAVGKKRNHGIMFGYRYKEAEFDEDGLNEDYQYKGLLAGFNFRF